MATDSATLKRQPRVRLRRHERAENLAARSPAAPIARGVGLDRPFFEDKDRAFWILQTGGWVGYFILRALSGFANGMPAILIVHIAILTATGYSLTLLMATLFRHLIVMRPMFTLLLSLLVVPAFYVLLAPFTRSPEAVGQELDRLEAQTPAVGEQVG